MLKYILLMLVLFTSSIKAQKIDTIRVGEQFKKYDLLKEGLTKYIVYSKLKGATRLGVLMEASVKKIEHEGKSYLAIEHHAFGADSKSSGGFYSLVEPKTFRPVIHIRNSEAKGKEAYKFTENALIALDSVKNNSEEGYHLDLDEPIFNFELDLETFSMLPMRDGYRAVLQFYHPGSNFGGPDWYEIKVVGSEELSLPGGKNIDTWVLYMDYKGEQPTKFWYSKGDQKFIKMEGNYRGINIYKTRLF